MKYISRLARQTILQAILLGTAACDVVARAETAKIQDKKDDSGFVVIDLSPSSSAASKTPWSLESQPITDRSSSLRGSMAFPPIPPIHPHHTGSVHYSSVLNPDGSTTYRRDINAPCDYGMLVFNVGPASDDMPYKYDLYGDAYLYDNSAGLCILYPSYTGYQESKAPYWKLGYDPMTVIFKDLRVDFDSMHRISSRVEVPANANKNSKLIDPDLAGDYIIVAPHDFYSIQYYKQLKFYVNSWESGLDAATG